MGSVISGGLKARGGTVTEPARPRFTGEEVGLLPVNAGAIAADSDICRTEG
jgi:hypothetical protein